MKDGVTMVKDTNYGRMMSKAELLQKGIFFPHPYICQRRIRYEKVGN
jgi:hypothetical protein